MAEKESIKVSLGTTICIFIIILLIVGLGVVYYLGFVKNNERISELEAQTIALENDKAKLEQENQTKISKVTETTNENINANDNEGQEFILIYNAVKKDLEEMKKNPKSGFIVSDNKIEDIKILSIDIDRTKALMGNSFVSGEYPDVYNDDNLIVGTVEYALKLDKTEGLQVAGSGDTKFVENWFVNTDLFIYNKTLNTVELATGL
jgi:uncharacterized protein YpmB